MTPDRQVNLHQSSPPDQWCPVCKRYHKLVGKKTDAGRLTRPCPLLPADDPRNRC